MMGYQDATEGCFRRWPLDGIIKCHNIYVLAVDSGAVKGAWIDCKHKIITNEALFFRPIHTFLYEIRGYNLLWSIAPELDNIFVALCRILPWIVFGDMEPV